MMPDLFRAEIDHYWPMERELLATIAETLHSLLLVTAKAYGGKNLPEQLRIPRPGQPEWGFESPPGTPAGEGSAKVLSFSEFATMLRSRQ
jgi:hypothetical protein